MLEKAIKSFPFHNTLILSSSLDGTHEILLLTEHASNVNYFVVHSLTILDGVFRSRS